MLQASVLTTFSNIEISKITGLIFAGTAFCLAVSGCRVLGLTKARSLCAGVIVICNPVLISQCLTFYNDYICYCCIVILLSAFVRISRREQTAVFYYLLVSAIVIAAGVKFTAFFYIGVTVFAAVLWFLIKRQWRLAINLALGAALVALISFAVIFRMPYITNWMDHGSPVYPLMGDGAIDIMTGNTPGYLLGKNRLFAVIVSLLHPVRNINSMLPIYDSRISGFTVIMPIILTVIAICLVVFRKKTTPAQYFSIAAILVSCFIFEQCWWARYIPQLWLIVPVSVLFWPIKGFCTVTLLSIMAFLFSLKTPFTNFKAYREMNRFLEENRECGVAIPTHNQCREQLLKKKGIPYVVDPELTMEEADYFEIDIMYYKSLRDQEKRSSE